MARPLDDENQYLLGYAFFKAGLGTATGIERRLGQSFGDAAKPARTIRTWIPKYEDLGRKSIDLDHPFQWHRGEDFGVPWEAGGLLMDITRCLGWLAVSFRLARWAWRLHLAVPSLSAPRDIVSIAAGYAWRELRSQVLAKPFHVEDLNAVIAYQPWQGADFLARYKEAIRMGDIPALEVMPMDTWESGLLSIGEGLRSQPEPLNPAIEVHLTLFAHRWPRRVEAPWELPSQVAERMMGRAASCGSVAESRNRF